MFIISKRLNKLLACFLTALLLSNTVALLPVYAAASAHTGGQTEELPEITLDKQAETPQSNLNINAAHLTTKQQFVQLLNQLIPYYAQNGKQQGPQWLRTTDINLTFTEDFKPIYSLETLQPFTKEVVDGRLSFWQGRYAYQSGANSTANLGVGLRWLSDDKTSIAGINTFYDYAFKHDLSRVGIGAEYFNKQAEYRANVYIPTSGDRQTGKSVLTDGILYSYIRAVSGFDYEVGTSLANAPWLSLYASGFHYDNKYQADENGYRLRGKMQLTPRLSMEMGYTHSNLSNGSLYGKVLYQLADTAGPALRGGSDPERASDISHKLLQKVQRENEIKTETFTKLVANTGSLSVTVTNSSGVALQGVQVQAWQNGSPVGAAAVTGAAGTAVLSGLATGTYTVRAAYFSVSGDSPAVTVQKDQMTTVPAIALAVVGGKAKITVHDSAGAGVAGATVTAEVADGLHGAADKNFFDRLFGVKTAYAAAAFTVTAVTDANGIATFANLPPGNYKFTVIDNGKEMKSLAVAVPDGSTSNATVVLPASGGNIVAMISDAVSNVAINGAAVELKSGSTVVDTKTTGSDGTAVFSGLTAGSAYTIAASAANYSSKSINTTVTDKETVAAAIALTPTQQTGNANITVTDGAGPVSGAAVSVTVNGQPRTETTGADGVAVFANLPSGTYGFTATMAGYDSGAANDVTITGGMTATAAISLTRETGGLAIAVTDASGISLGFVTIRITADGQFIAEGTNLPSGTMGLTDLPIGEYTVTVTKDGYVTGTENVTVTSGATASKTVALARQTGGVRIDVSDGVSTALSGAIVSVTIDGQERTATADAGGIATFTDLPTGSYIFTAAAGGYDSGSLTITITSGTMPTEYIFLNPAAPAAGSATITVKEGALPLSGATVSVTVPGEPQPRTETTGADGVASFANLPPGAYSFTASKAGYTSDTANVTVTSGATASATVALTPVIPPGSAVITVNAEGSPLSGATVVVPVNGVNRTVTTDANGEAAFADMPPGVYSFGAYKANYSSTSVDGVVITSGAAATGTINLTRQTGSLTIRVREPASPPVVYIEGATVTVTGSGIAQGVTRTVQSDADGKAVFSDLPTGNYTFSVTKTGYANGSGTAVITNIADISTVISLAQTLVDIGLAVRDFETGLLLGGVTVTITNGAYFQTQTSVEGETLRFENVPVGACTFTLTKAGYYTITQIRVMPDDGTAPMFVMSSI